ncbi:MAG TPA: hypothetical protein VEW94_03375 [Chloroflexia bacterium]|nr:hypothetical protein [Chloroflexia bacterium]
MAANKALIHLDVNYHQQDNKFSCGAACAQMLLVSQVNTGTHLVPQLGPHLGQDLASTPNGDYQQTVAGSPGIGLNTAIHNVASANFGAGTHPKALKQVLNAYRNKATYKGIQFKVFVSPSPEEIICRIVHTLDEHRIAPAVLVNGGMHWIDVTSCNYNLVPGPVPGTNDGIEVIDFIVNDPWPPSLAGASKVHKPDDACGKGVSQDNASPIRGYISCHGWLNTYMAKPVPPHLVTPQSNKLSTGFLSVRFVAVCAIHAPSTGKDNTPKYKKFICA